MKRNWICYCTAVLLCTAMVAANADTPNAGKRVRSSEGVELGAAPTAEQPQVVQPTVKARAGARISGAARFAPQPKEVYPVEPGEPVFRQGGEDCAAATVIAALPYSNTGTTTGALDDYDEPCELGGGASPDVVYSYRPAVDECIWVSMCTDSVVSLPSYTYRYSEFDKVR